MGKQSWKRLVSLLLATIMVMSMMPVNVLAESLHGSNDVLVVAEKASQQKDEDSIGSDSLSDTRLEKFTAGYAWIKANTRMYEKSNLKTQVERINDKCVVYAFSYKEKNNAVRVAYVDGQKVRYAWVDGARLDFMDKKEAKAYKKEIKGSDFEYKGNPLEVTSLQSNEVVKPSKEPTPTPTPRRIKHNVTPTPMPTAAPTAAPTEVPVIEMAPVKNDTGVAKIGETFYEKFADALTAAAAMTGEVVIEIFDKVTLNASLSGSYDSIKFVGKDTDAEIYLDVQGYITATGKKVAFGDLTLSKSAGGFITNAGFMNVAFGVYDVAEVTYNKCTFANGAYASSGKVTYTGCTFYRSYDKYGLWAYGDVDVTVDGCIFDDYRGIKMYAEGAAKTVDLTVKNTNFSKLTDKPAIVLTYGESVTLKGNTYSSTGTFELDLDGAPNGTAVTSDVPPTCVNDKGACGVLVDGKIYTTVAQAAEVAKAGSTVTLLHDSTDNVEFDEGVTLNKNGFTADGVTTVPTGYNSFAYTKEVDGYVRVWGEGGGNASESFVLKLYSDETLIATTELNNVGGIIDGDVHVTWNFFYPVSNDEYWTTTWEEGHPNPAAQPTEVKLYIDGALVATTDAKMSGADDVNPVVWKDLGGVKYVVTGLTGNGTEADPYLINDLDELKWFHDQVDMQAADGSTQFAGKYFKLTADIDLAGINWDPIGSMSGDHGSFKGIFDGDNHTISNLNVQQAGNGLGLFARTAGNAVIKNLTLNNVTVKSTDNSNYVGGVVGNSYASTKIENVHVTGNINISGRGYIGGISGHGYVVMDNVSVVGTGTISSTFWCAGGILGYAGEGSTNIMNAHVEGITITSAAGGLGAIVGMAEDNNGTQPISGSNLSAKNVQIKTYKGAYGDNYANYALGYLYGGNPTSKLTGNLSVDNVKIETSNGVAPKVVDAVASVGDAIYFDLQAAIDAADGKTVTLLRDLTIASDLNNAAKGYFNIADGQKVTIDLNGKTINATDNSTGNFILFYNYGELTIKNGTVNLTATNDREWNAQSTIILNRGGVLTIESGTYTHQGGTDMAFVVDNSGNYYGDATTNINGGILNSSYTAIRNRMEQNSHGASGKAILNVSGGDINGITSAIWAQAASTSTTAPATGAINISGGEVGAINTARSAGAECMTTITGGTVAAFKGEVNELTVKAPGAITGTVTIMDADGNEVPYYVTANGLYTEAVAAINGVGYATLDAAFAAAADGDTITLLSDISLSEMIINTKKVTLDLNGKTITGTDNTSKNFSLIDNRGTLTITGNGTMTLTATVNSGWSRYSAVIANNPGGKLVIENGTFEHLGGTDMAYGIDNLTNGKGTYAETVINGGNIKSTYRAIRQFLNGVEAQNILTVNGGTIEGTNKSIWMQDPSKNANTGTLTVGANANLKGDVNLTVTEGSTEWPVEISIAAAALKDGATVLTSNVPDGYVVENKNGTYGVEFKPELPTATVTEIENTDLTFAMNFKADEVTDAQLDYYGSWYADFVLTVNKDVTFNANGGADGYLSGQYDAWSSDWVNVPFEDVTIKANESLKIMEYAAELMGQPGLKLTYNDVYSFVKDFDCGVFFEDEFLKANPDLEVKLELRMYNPENESESYAIGKTYTFEAPVQLPEVVVTDIKNTLKDTTDPDLTFALNFAIKDVENLTPEYLEKLFDEYGKHYVDYVLTISGLTDADVTFNADGDADGYLAGQYDAWSEDWVSVPFEDVTVKNGESLYIMEYAAKLMGQSGLRFTLAEVAEIVQNFDCGVYFTPDFLAANPDMKVTLELKVFTEDAAGIKVDDISVAYNEFNVNDYVAIVSCDDKQTKYFKTFADAYAAAAAGDTITLLAPVVVNAGETLTLDKAVTIEYTSDVMGEAMITNNGGLTISGNGKIVYTYTGAADSNYGKGNYTIANNGKLTVDGATIENATAAMKHASYAITNGNGGEIIVKKGHVVNNNNYAVRMFGNGSMTVEGGEVKGTRAVWMQAPGSNTADAPAINLTVNGGKLTAIGESGGYKLAVYSYSYGNSLENVSITVNDGELDGDIALSGGNNKTVAETVTITGGKITDLYSYAEDEVAAKTVNVFGGTFVKPVAEAYCAEGYIPEDNGDGTYGVKAGAYVAQIGEKKFETLAEALNAAQDGETITLLKDVTLTGKLIVDKNVTIDGNGHSIIADENTKWYKDKTTNFGTSKDYYPWVLVQAHGATLKNVTIDSNHVAGGVKVENAENVVFDNVSIIGAQADALTVVGSVNLKTYLKLETTSTYIDARSGIVNAETGTVFDMTKFNGSVSPAKSDLKGAVDTEGNPFFCAHDNTTYYTSLANKSSFSNLTLLNDVELTSDITLSGKLDLNGHNLTVAEGKVIKVSGALKLIGETTAPFVLTAAGATLTAPAGATVTTSVDGYKVVYEDGKYKLAQIFYVAQVGEKKFESLAEALTAAQDGDTITLLDNIVLTEGVTVPAGKIVTLELNGKTISRNTEATVSSAAITNNGNLTIQDTIGGGKITAFAQNPDTAAIPYYASNTINNCGVLTVKSGTIENSTSNDARAAFPIDNNSTLRDAIVTIEGGTITGRGAIRQFANSTTHKNEVNITGGTVSGSSYGVWVQNPGSGDPVAALNISENAEVAKVLVSPSSNFKIAITGGTISEVAIWSADTTNTERNPAGFITGGTFGADPSDFVADGYTAVDNGNSTYTVKAANVEMDGVYYNTIKDALATLKSADTTVHTVKVLLDHEIDVNYSTYNYPILVNGFVIELDLNGKTITADWSKYTGNRVDNALIGVANGGKLDIIDSVGEGKIVNKDTKENVENRIFWIMTSTATKSIVVNIKGGTFIQNDVNTALLYVQGNKPSDNLAPMYVKITGGHFETVNDDFFNAYDGFQHESYITGGTFNKNPTDGEIKIAEGYEAVEGDDGLWTVQEKKLFDIAGASIKAGDSLKMYFFVKASDLSGNDYYAEITKGFADGREDVVWNVPYSSWEDQGTYIRFAFDDISAKEMTDDITVVVYNTEKEPVSNVWVDSVEKYAIRTLKNPSSTDKLKTAMVDMLNYGAAAQTYFAYNVSDLANAEIDSYQLYATESVTYSDKREKGPNYYGSTVSAKENLVLTLYFQNITRDMDAVVSYIDHYGNSEFVEISGDLFRAYNDKVLGVDVTGLAIADGRQVVTCEIKDSEGNVVASAKDSIESYVARMSDTDPVFELLMKFVQSAYNYFNE